MENAEHAKAISNFEAYFKLQPGSTTLEEVINSSSGLKGWVNWKPGDIPQDERIEFMDDKILNNEEFKKNVAIPYFKDIYKDLVA